MIAFDTNLLARLLLRDDKRQHARVVQLFAGQQDFTAPVSVMLELVWVLESQRLQHPGHRAWSESSAGLAQLQTATG